MNKRGEERGRISLKTISFNETILGFLKTYYYTVCACTCACERASLCVPLVFRCPLRPEGLQFPHSGVIGSCKPDVGVGNQT